MNQPKQPFLKHTCSKLLPRATHGNLQCLEPVNSRGVEPELENTSVYRQIPKTCRREVKTQAPSSPRCQDGEAKILRTLAAELTRAPYEGLEEACAQKGSRCSQNSSGKCELSTSPEAGLKLKTGRTKASRLHPSPFACSCFLFQLGSFHHVWELGVLLHTLARGFWEA